MEMAPHTAKGMLPEDLSRVSPLGRSKWSERVEAKPLLSPSPIGTHVVTCAAQIFNPKSIDHSHAWRLCLSGLAPETFVKGPDHSGSDRNRWFPTSGRGAPGRDTMPPFLRLVRAFRCIRK